MDILVQQVTGGLAVGGIYALIALGFTMMLRATDLVNFAQGEFVMTGAFLGYTLLSLSPMPYVLVFLIVSLATGALGMAVEYCTLRPIRERQALPLNLLIATVGIGIVLRVAALLIWGGEPLRYPPRGAESSLLLAGVPVSGQHLVIIVLAGMAMLALHLFFQRTLPGMAWRATAYDPATAEILGIGTSRVVTVTFGISSALAGAAGVLIAPLFFVATDLWLLGPRTFAAAALGQFSILGTMLGGPILGLLETLAAGYLSSAFKNGIAYAITIVVLMVIAVPAMPAAGRLGHVYARASLGEVLGWSQDRLLRWRRVMLLSGSGAVLALPLLLGDYGINVCVLVVIYMIAALGLQLVIGYGGSIVVGHAAFVGIGAYASSLASIRLGAPFLLAVPAGAVLAGLTGLLFAPVLRLPGHYCAIATLGFGEIVNLLLVNWTAATNGMSGLGNIPRARLGPFTVGGDHGFFYVALVVLLLVYLGLGRLVQSRFGRALLGARENELAATAMGVNVPKYRARAFAAGAACAGIAGSLYAFFTHYISPDSFTVVESIGFLTMVVLGGLGSLPGALIGAAVVTGVPEVLRGLGEYRILVYGVLLVAFMMGLPGGLADLLPRLGSAIRSRLTGFTPAAEGVPGGNTDS